MATAFGTSDADNVNTPSFTSAKVLSGLIVLVLATAASLTNLSSAESVAKGRGGRPQMSLEASGAGKGGAARAGANKAQKPKEVVDEGPLRTVCTSVVHIGNSTSIGVFSEFELPTPDDNVTLAYQKVGASSVVTNVFGVRSTTEGWNEYPSDIGSVAGLLPGVPADNYWVIATGVNDAANFAVGADQGIPDRIRAMMGLLEGKRVMWVTTASDTQTGPWVKENMVSSNRDLRTAQENYPNLRMFDWAVEVDKSWYRTGGFVHDSTEGNAERSRRFAAVLAKAFPTSKPDGSSDVVVNSGL